MKFLKINISAAGLWPRDCELINLIQCQLVIINYYKEEDNTYWSIKCEGNVAYKIVSEEFSRSGYLIDLPVDGSFFEILNSPWIEEFRKTSLKF